MNKILSVILITIFFVSAAFGADYPERIVLKQDGKDVAYYNIAGMKYRSESLFDAADIKPDIPVCFAVKLEDANNSDDILFYGSINMGTTFSLAEGVNLPSKKKGTNLLVGCKRGKGEKSFVIYAASIMRGDLALFDEKKENLESDKSTTPEDYLLLGDWMDMAKKQSQIIEEDVYNKYVDNTNNSYRKGLALIEKAVSSKAAKLQDNYLRIKDFADRMGDAPEGKAAAIVSSYYREIVTDNSALLKKLKDGDLGDTEKNKMAADIYLILAKVYDELLLDKENNKRLIVNAAKKAPNYSVVARKMEEMGFVLYDEKWITELERDELVRKEEEEMQKKLLAEKEKKKEKAKEVIQKALESGTGVEKARLDVDYLLSLEKASGLKELEDALADMPIEVSYYAMFEMASWYPEESDKLLGKILEGKNANLKKYAAGILCAMGADAAQKVNARFVAEKDEDVLKGYVDALWQVGGKGGIANMLSVVRSTGMPKEVRLHAASYLVKVSGKNLGLDSFAWKKWWNDNAEKYVAEPVYQTGK